MRLTACLAFFSPADFELPRRHLRDTLAWLVRERVPAVLAQVVRTGQEPQPVPDGVQSLVYRSDDVLFLKENLWNLAALETDSDTLLFLDTDICFSVDDVAGATAKLLEQCDVCQPFETAMWLNRDGAVDFVRTCSAKAIAEQVEPVTRAYHPGFAWAMTREAFGRLGGFYDRHPFGGGDTAFSFGLWGARPTYPLMESIVWDTPSFIAYQRNAASAALRVGYLQGVAAMHRWHGSVANRQYVTRTNCLPIEAGQEYPLRRRPDGLLAWESAAANAAMTAYFASRREDG